MIASDPNWRVGTKSAKLSCYVRLENPRTRYRSQWENDLQMGTVPTQSHHGCFNAKMVIHDMIPSGKLT